MSFPSLHTGVVLVTVLVLSASGCSSPPWRKQQTVSQQEKDAYFEQAAARIQYDDLESAPNEYQSQPVSESNYAPVPPVSRNAGGGSGSCCH